MKRVTIATDVPIKNDTDEPKSRIEIRVDREQKLLLERAAALTGASLSAFMLTRCTLDAVKILSDYQTTTLSLEAWEKFQDMLAHPPKPNKALIKSLQKHKARQTSRSNG